MRGSSAVPTVVIVPLGDVGPAVARRLADQGATVVLVAGDDGVDEAGRLAAELETAGHGRPAVFAAAGGLEGLDEFVAELFSPRQ